MFHRFARSNRVDGMHAREGFFSAAYEIMDQPNLDRQTLDRLNESLLWFRQNLPVPARFNRSKSKGFYRKTATRGLSWFKPTAKEHLAKAFALAALLEENGHVVEVLRTSRPGYIVYEDEYQVVAEPFSDSLKL
ncbi:hypothetical protein [Mesorhizobium sp. CN2-181]|uniref:hypothetical protein n=1 Tax=Mesorhizobium yinganensis TaxID=3157707 RepID=UPI0032B71C6F